MNEQVSYFNGLVSLTDMWNLINRYSKSHPMRHPMRFCEINNHPYAGDADEVIATMDVAEKYAEFLGHYFHFQFLKAFKFNSEIQGAA